MLQQKEVLLVALVATLKCPPAGMAPDARLQQQVMLAALQMLTFITPDLEATPDTYTVLKVSFILALGFVVVMRTVPWSCCFFTCFVVFFAGHADLNQMSRVAEVSQIQARVKQIQQHRELQIVRTSAHAS